MRPCFNFKPSAADATEQTLSIYDVIGLWGVQAADFRASLDAVTAPVLNVEISSPGGDVFAGIAMYNMLKASGKTIHVKVMGVAASAASLIAMAGDKRIMPKNTHMMVHNAAGSGPGRGTATDHRAQADLLDKIEDGLVATYVAATGLKEDAVRDLLSKDTWLTADEALAQGFATEVTEAIEATAAFDMDRADLPAHIKAIYMQSQKTPEEIAAAEAARLAQVEADRVAAEASALAALPNQAVATQINDLAVQAGLKDQAAFLAISCDTVDAAKARIQVAREIVAFYAFAKKPEKADADIRANKSVAEVRAALVAEMAENDVHTSNVRKDAAKNASTAQPVASTNDIWAKRK